MPIPGKSRVSLLPEDLPWQRIRLHIREALHGFLNAFLVAETRVLDAAERGELQAIAGHLADVDRADVELAHKARDVVQPVGAYRGRQPVGGSVRDADRLVDVAEAN